MTTSNKCQGTIHTTRVEAAGAPVLTKRDCETVKTDVRDAEKGMSWFKWIATKDDSSRNPWVIFSKYNECKRLPQQLDAEAYTTLRDRLQAYDRGELPMSGQDAMELRRTVNLVQARYDGVPSPYRPKLADYISPAEQEIYDRFGNNLTMAVMPVTIPGIAGTRAMGGTEAQARAGGELSAMAFGFMGGAFMAKHGLLKQSVKPAPAQQTTSQPVPTQRSVGNGLVVAQKPVLTIADFPTIGTRTSQKQYRHVEGRPEYRGGGYLKNTTDAQAVLDKYHSGDSVILGKSQAGFPIVRVDGVTGINVNLGAGISSQPTNIFMIKGTASPSVVPMNPNWSP